ncbi:hypothetical protein JA1_000389 [Spathaspora sp. JA1]|nr:hypothetical protein JA1_000389 [Spathaspora sp. JA1]
MAEVKKIKVATVKPRKHVSKACLECRKRHFKCDGTTPRCDRCVKSNKECTYVASHRGGSRRKGVSAKAAVISVNDINQGPKLPMYVGEIEDFTSSKRPLEEGLTPPTEVPAALAPLQARVDNIHTNQDMVKEVFKLPCSIDHDRCANSDCPGRSAVAYFDNRDKESPLTQVEAQMVDNLRKKIKLDHTLGNLDCLFAGRESIKDVKSFQQLEMTLKVHNFANFMDPTQFDKGEILTNYYTRFHQSHPLLPPKDELMIYLANSNIEKELLPILKLIGDGQTTSIYAKQADLITDRLIQCVNIVKDNNQLDIISIQVLLLVAIAAHISSFHAFSKKLRHFCIFLIEDMKINIIDKREFVNPTADALTPTSSIASANSPGQGSNVFQSSRLSHIASSSIADNARRVFWELYFFDVIIGSADGKSVTGLDALELDINYPTVPSQQEFDYKGRAEAGKLVTQAVKMNVELIDKKPYESTLARLKAALSSWEMKLEDPKLFGAPPLIHKNGTVNEGVHQAILLYNYAKIFAHRPFSYLWKINSPQNPKCNDEVLEAKDVPTTMKADSRTNIETKKTIEAANSIVEVLIDTNASKVLNRTPLFACGLALASLVHLSAYIWVETTLANDSNRNFDLNENDLEIYTEYIKLSLTAIYPISTHWTLSGKLAKHIRESLTTLRPKLYSKLKDFLPRIEVGMEQMTISDSSNSTVPSAINSTHAHNILSSDTTPGTSYTTGYDSGDAVVPNYTPNYLNTFDSTNLDYNTGNGDLDGLQMGQMSPMSDTGCDWIDKALIDFFDEDNIMQI